MALEARVKQDYFMKTVTAFSGREYLKSEWRPVPEQFEKQALTHEMLEVRETVPAAPQAVEELEMAEPALKTSRRTHRKNVKDIEAEE